MYYEPAFPRPASEYTASGSCPNGNKAEDAQSGMTLRDYFAAKAPNEIPDWFRSKWFKANWKNTVRRPESMDQGLQLQNARLRGAITEWWRTYNVTSSKGEVMPYALKSVGETEGEKAYLEKWESDFEAYADACEDQKNKHEESLFLAWRYGYADLMLEARKQKGTPNE